MPGMKHGVGMHDICQAINILEGAITVGVKVTAAPVAINLDVGQRASKNVAASLNGISKGRCSME
jgi:hypothetical protein